MPRKAVKRTAWKRIIARTTRTISAVRHSTTRTCVRVTTTIVTTVTPVLAKNDEPSKGQKHTAEIIVEVRDKNGAMIPTRALLDTGTSASILLEPFKREGTAHMNKSGDQQWETLSGRYATTNTANV
jgi:hypothetical protein